MPTLSWVTMRRAFEHTEVLDCRRIRPIGGSSAIRPTALRPVAQRLGVRRQHRVAESASKTASEAEAEADWLLMSNRYSGNGLKLRGNLSR